MNTREIALWLALAASIFIGALNSVFVASIWIRLDIAERTGTERVIIVQHEPD